MRADGGMWGKSHHRRPSTDERCGSLPWPRGKAGVAATHQVATGTSRTLDDVCLESAKRGYSIKCISRQDPEASSAVGPLRADVDLARLPLASKITPASANTPACPD